MVRIEDFSDLNRKQRELLGKGFNHQSPFLGSFSFREKDTEFKFKASEKHLLDTLKSIYKQATLSAEGSNSISHTYGNFLLIAKKRGKEEVSYVSLTYNPKEVLEDLKLTTEISTKSNPSLEVFYKHPNAVTRLKLDAIYNLNARASLGKPELGGGFKGNLNLKELNLSKYEIGFWWFQKNRKMVAKHIYTGKYRLSIFDRLFFSYYHKLNPTTHLAGSARLNLNSLGFYLEFGGRHQLDDTNFIKAKFNSKGLFSLAHSINLAKLFHFNTSAQIDLRKLSSDAMNSAKVGVRLDFKV
jgi:hypothetical protein